MTRSLGCVMDLKTRPPMPRKRDFRIGCLGSGFIMRDCHLVAYRKAGFNPVGIASRSVEHARETAEKHRISKVYRDYDELLQDPDIEVLDIAVAPRSEERR